MNPKLDWSWGSTQAHPDFEKGGDEAAELRRLREVLASMPGMVYQVGLDDRLMPKYYLLNDGGKAVFGLTAPSMYDNAEKMVYGVHREDRAKVTMAFMNSARDGEPVRLTYRYGAPDGSWRWTRTHVVPIKEPGGRFHWNGFTYDITKEVQLQEQLAEAKAAAEAASRAKSEFLANMSHEIRTPMNAILSFAYLGLRTLEASRQRQYFAEIESAAQSLLTIVNDVLDLSKVEAGKLELIAEPFGLVQAIDHFESVVGLRAREKGLDFRVDIADDVPRFLVGDALRLGQVLLNLGGNAVKFTEAGAVTVAVRALERGDTDTLLEFCVRDTGIGLSAEQATRLFAPFVQADSSTTRRFGGTGLGLSISKRLVELMGGEIGVDSQPGQGSCFRFTVRLGITELMPDLRTRKVVAPEQQLAGLEVLVVDDHEANLEVARNLLESAGVIVSLASSGPHAIARVAQQRFDAVFMDVRMPEMDGIEATTRIRAAEAPGRRVPIIALTANVMAPDRERCLSAGMDDFVGKPIDVEGLFAALARAAGRQEVNPELAPPAAPVALDHDYSTARARVARVPELYERLASHYLNAGDEPLRNLRQLAEAQAWSDAARVAHTLKGTAAQLGALRVSRLAGQLEVQLDSGRPASDEALAMLEAALADSAARLRELLASPAPVAEAAASDARAANLRRQLIQDLEDGEDGAWDRYEQWLAALPAEARAAQAAVGAHIASEEYAAALDLLGRS